jgi:hypothetical protein
MPTEPLDTVMAGAPRHAVVAASLISVRLWRAGGQAPRVLDLEEPAGTQVGGSKAALVAAFLAQHNTGEPGIARRRIRVDHRDARLDARRRGRAASNASSAPA